MEHQKPKTPSPPSGSHNIFPICTIEQHKESDSKYVFPAYFSTEPRHLKFQKAPKPPQNYQEQTTRLYCCSYNARKESVSLAQLALNFFDPLLPREMILLEKFISNAAERPKPDHLLGLFRSSFLSFFKDKKKSSIHQVDHSSTSNVAIDVPLLRPAVTKRKLMHCVSELTEAGIIFKKRENHDLLDIEFKNGILYIPPLGIDDSTCPVFLNFIAYEQCNINAEPYFTHYFLLFDSLVNSSKDVEHLRYTEIIEHELGNDEDVADLFNKLCKEVVHDVNNCYLSQVSKDVNRHFRKKGHRWFPRMSTTAIFLFLTVVSTFFAVFAYVRPTSNK